MANLHVKDKTRLASTAGRSVRYLVMATGVPVVVCAVAGGRVMGLLFGDHFVQAGGALGILASMAMLSATGTVILYLLVAAHLETALYRNTLAFAAVNVAMCFPLIRSYGYVGASVAMVLTSAASQVSLALLPSTRDYVQPCLSAALRTFTAVALAVAALHTADAGDLVGSFAAVVLYLVLLVVLGVLNREELRFLRMMFGAFSRDAAG
jgi:O-antigen/teichoic acid export membrane protein